VRRTELRFVQMSRRQDVIDVAVTLMREGGPDALTTVAVASRLGVTQSAIYRHIHNRDELATLASRQIVADLQAKVKGILDNPNLSWANDGDTRVFCDGIVALMAAEPTTFEVIDRWRYADGALGIGIRELLDHGRAGTAEILESMWRVEYGYEAPLDRGARAALMVYAGLADDDVINIARLVRAGRFPGGRDAIARILELSLIGRYRAFMSDVNRRLGLPPVLN
jgi:AcrR family transcriptional regulator